MGEITEYRIQQIVDNGQIVQIALAEDVHTEPISQKQLIMESIAKKLDLTKTLLSQWMYIQ